MAAIPILNESVLESLCKVLGATNDGLTGTEIGRYLRECGIEDPCSTLAKRHRLYEALKLKQHEDRCANNLLAFLQKVINPVLYHQMPEYYPAFIERINRPLAFAGYQVNEKGQIQPVSAAQTLDEAAARAGRLKSELRRRNVHPDVLVFCSAEFLQENYFHAVLEATKSVSEKIRKKSGLSGDAGELARDAFSLGKIGTPYLAFNAVTTTTEKSEQSGLMNLFIGMFGAFRNTTAHEARINWKINEQDALDLMTLASLLHRRLDAAIHTGRMPE